MTKHFFIILFFFSILLNSCKNCETKTVSYVEQEPYQTTEKEFEKLKYHVSDGKIHYGRIDGAILVGDNPSVQVKCSVINDGNEGGEFVLYAVLSCQGDKIEIRESKFIPAQSIGEFEVKKEVNPFSFKTEIQVDDWGIIAPTVETEKIVTKYKDIVKYKQCNTCNGDCP
jgi:hypothetical protein